MVIPPSILSIGCLNMFNKVCKCPLFAISVKKKFSFPYKLKLNSLDSSLSKTGIWIRFGFEINFAPRASAVVVAGGGAEKSISEPSNIRTIRNMPKSPEPLSSTDGFVLGANFPCYQILKLSSWDTGETSPPFSTSLEWRLFVV